MISQVLMRDYRDTYMQSTGLLVPSWPAVLGCDASGVVVQVGDNAKQTFQVGDQVAGCTRLGVPGFSTFQEYVCFPPLAYRGFMRRKASLLNLNQFLMDAKLTLINKKYTLQQGATLGVGTYTAALGLYDGLAVELPDPNVLPSIKDEWVVVLGGAGSVGQYAVQVLKLSSRPMRYFYLYSIAGEDLRI